MRQRGYGPYEGIDETSLIVTAMRLSRSLDNVMRFHHSYLQTVKR
ncbi:hypothetical protein CCYS_11770 [Corynebacterium cystitidis DSM 20524]|uniref:Uncharacterized protein n=1 Tax=Corynebacterium cystitidis DSM 20524 TaxID=1121357 RepID=A0A1H9W790_9CORY|nr:hypothetical protein CCYS_11770 [Corynebacterium cystitidis DSM 20524]SES29649.1 hypothetical protein SAMN05661109_02574 [Corynebacterium cystitidis DSM 20524]SNV67966.1 Uncharacterised protein [Corynebacterium cystitidis]